MQQQQQQITLAHTRPNQRIHTRLERVLLPCMRAPRQLRPRTSGATLSPEHSIRTLGRIPAG